MLHTLPSNRLRSPSKPANAREAPHVKGFQPISNQRLLLRLSERSYAASGAGELPAFHLRAINLRRAFGKIFSGWGDVGVVSWNLLGSGRRKFSP